MATPFPRLTPAQFGNPANLRFAYSGCQTVVYNRALGEIIFELVYKILDKIIIIN
jgi:hypothetical protein